MKLRIKYLLIVTLLVVISGLSLVKSSAAGTKLTKTVELNGDIITETLWNGVQLERMAIKAERAGSERKRRQSGRAFEKGKR